jgi:hypothetical protein
MVEEDPGEEAAESEWRFPLSEFDDGESADPLAAESAGEQSGSTESDAARDDGGETERIEPGGPTLEGVFFVLLGVAFALFVISRLVVG